MQVRQHPSKGTVGDVYPHHNERIPKHAASPPSGISLTGGGVGAVLSGNASYTSPFTSNFYPVMDTLSRSSRRSFPFRSLQNEVNQLFESVFPASGENGDSTSAVWAPRMDVKETDDRYRLSLDLPGVSKDDVSITVEDNRLTIRGERQGETRSEDENVVRMERSFGRFYRTLRLPESVNEEQITATFDDGVLSVDLPKTEKSTPTNISIS